MDGAVLRCGADGVTVIDEVGLTAQVRGEGLETPTVPSTPPRNKTP